MNPHDLNQALRGFTPASAELLGERALLRRVDTKFVIPADLLPALLAPLADHYAALGLASPAAAAADAEAPYRAAAVGAPGAPYRTLYFDTEDRRCFHDHRRGRRIRDKIRIRHYDDRRVSYLEVKGRRNASHTDKHRTKIGYGQDVLDDAGRRFLRAHSVVPPDALRPELWVDYRRLMLIGRERDERCTFDVALAVSTPDRSRSAPALDKIVFVEVKQPMVDLSSPVMRGLAAIHQRPRSASKYIFAVTSLHPEVRANRLLPDLRTLHRMAR